MDKLYVHNIHIELMRPDECWGRAASRYLLLEEPRRSYSSSPALKEEEE
jgi:hypothetical protein